MASSSTSAQSSITLPQLLRGESSTLLSLLKWWVLLPVLLLFLGASFLLYQTPGNYGIDVGSPSDEAYTLNFHTRLSDGPTTYRWSDVYGFVLFPGIGGSRPFTTTLTLDMGRTAPLQVYINGTQMYSSTLASGWNSLVMRVDETHPQALQSRDTVVELRSTDYRADDSPTEPKGVKVDSVVITQDPNGAIIWPPVVPLLWFAVALALLYIIVGRAALNRSSLQRARLYGSLALLVLGAVILWLLSPNRMFIAADAGHIAATLAGVFLISLVVEWLLRLRGSVLAAQHCRILAGLMGLAFLLRFGGMALPQSVIVDMPYHMKWLNTLLIGDWQSLYFPGGLSAVPREWGMELLIPKSPLFYFAFVPISILPFDLETSAKWLISLIDSSVVMVVFWLARRAGGRVGAALFASALYAVMPLAFRAFAYGILPTIFAQWLAVLLFAALLGLRPTRSNLWTWFGVLLLTIVVLLSFPTVALFVTIVVAAYALLLLFRPSLRPQGSSIYPWQLITLLVGAGLISLWAYYGLYVAPVMTSISALLAPKAGQAPTVRWPGGWPDLIAWTANYVVTVLPLLLAAIGFALLLGRRRLTHRRRAVVLLALWMFILPLFFFVNYKVDMIGKHLFFTMVPVTVAGGVALFAFARRGRWSTVFAGLAVAIVAWQGLIFWISRLVGQSS
ncbi:MAG: hypothetical protein ABJA50_01530 [Chloroflexota bacterium]